LRTAYIGFWMCPLMRMRARIRKDQGAQTFSVLRHIALNLLKPENSTLLDVS
jgi:hypothetical protein